MCMFVYVCGGVGVIVLEYVGVIAWVCGVIVVV